MIDSHPPPSDCRRPDRLPAAGPLVQQRLDRSRNPPGRDRPVRQAGADHQPLQGRAISSAASGAGLAFRIPFVENIVWIDKRVRDIDMDRQQVLSTDQRRLEVDAFARYRVVDPLRMYLAARVGRPGRAGAEADPRLAAAQRAGQAALRLAAVARARGRDGEYPRRPRTASRANMASKSSTSGSRRRTCPTARRCNPPMSGCAPRGSRKRGRSAPRGKSGRRSSAPRPMPRRRKPMPRRSARIREFYNFYRAMQSYQTTFLPQRAGQGRADQHHPVAK